MFGKTQVVMIVCSSKRTEGTVQKQEAIFILHATRNYIMLVFHFQTAIWYTMIFLMTIFFRQIVSEALLLY